MDKVTKSFKDPELHPVFCEGISSYTSLDMDESIGKKPIGPRLPLFDIDNR
jgi:hypothetical protein